MADKILIRRDTAANWTSTDPTLSLGEMGFETDTNRFKIGDGATAWTAQAYVHPGSSWCDLRPVSIVHTSGTILVPTFTEAVDTDGYFEVGTPSRIFAPWTGLYHVLFSLHYAAAPGASLKWEVGVNLNRGGIATMFNDFPQLRTYGSYKPIQFEMSSWASGYISLTAGDYIEFPTEHVSILKLPFQNQVSVNRSFSNLVGGAQMRFIALT